MLCIVEYGTYYNAFTVVCQKDRSAGERCANAPLFVTFQRHYKYRHPKLNQIFNLYKFSPQNVEQSEDVKRICVKRVAV